MHLDLTNFDLFKDDNLVLDKSVNFIFGKNGTGKSTITSLIAQTMNSDVDVRIFQGFDSVLGEDDKLNAVILGEENTKINQQVKKKDEEILEIISEIEKIRLTISKPEDNKTENFYTKYHKALQEKKDKETEIDKFYTNSARQIASNSQLVQNARSYNKNVFKNEIANSKQLVRDEIEKFEEILKSENKHAKSVSFPIRDLAKYLDSVNEIISAKVESKIIIEELQSDPKKLTFAETGVEIHNEDENCSFCGNKISKERLHDLKEYFSADEVKELKDRIVKGKQLISKEIKEIKELEIDQSEFYPDFIESVSSLENKISNLKIEHLNFFQSLEKSLEEKEKYLFEQKERLNIAIPENYSEISKEYSELVEKNNDFSKNLIENQEHAKNALRYHEVMILVDNFQLEVKKAELDSLITAEENAKKNMESELAKIKEKEDDIKKIRANISTLITQTKNTRKLAENINNKLKTSVTFELIRKEEKDQEFYEVRGANEEIRSIKELSTGEKNIIAFLYFIEKLNEINESTERKDRIIVFDDPMNSNDDTMQYLIVDELQMLMKKVQKKNNSDKFILLTHNVFFYLNCSLEVRNRRDGKDAYKESNFYRLLSNNTQTKILRIENKNQDFKTNYEALWHELAFLYNVNKTELMLNPIRRIIETYIIFNGKEDFYKDNRDAKNLFNTNSHYFPDLEVDLNGKTREEITDIMKQCFKSNNAENHFNKHWKSAKRIMS